MNYNNKKKRQQQTSKSWFGFFAFIFLVCFGIAGYIYYKQDFSLLDWKEKAIQKISTYFPHGAHQSQPLPAKKLVADALQEKEPIKPIHFDFYDELPKTQLASSFSDDVIAEEKSAVKQVPKTVAKSGALTTQLVSSSATAKKKKDHEQNIMQELASDLSAIQATDTSTAYILQLSIFHSLGAANRYRAALASVGLKVDIVKLRLGKEVVYRLQQGPYHYWDQLKAAKKRLTERGVACDIRKASPYTM